MKTYKYYFAAFTAFLIWGFFSLALKPLQDFPSLDILFYRVFLSSIVMLLINLIFRRKIVKKNALLFSNLKPNDKKRIIFLTLGGSFLLIANWFVFIFAFRDIVSVILFIYFRIVSRCNSFTIKCFGSFEQCIPLYVSIT